MAAKYRLANGRHQRPNRPRTPFYLLERHLPPIGDRQAHRPCPRHILIHHRRHHLPHRRHGQRDLRRKRILSRRHQPKAVHHAVTTHRHGCLLLPLRRPRLLGESLHRRNSLHPGAVGANNQFNYVTNHPRCADTLAFDVDIRPVLPGQATIQGQTFITLCQTSAPILADTANLLPSAGIFRSPTGLAMINPLIGLFDPALSPVGLHSLWWVPITPCFDSVEIQVLILPTTTATVAYPAIPLNLGVPTLCQGAPQAWPTFTSGNSGGTFFANPIGLDLGPNGEIDPANSQTGTYTIQYATTGQCPDTVTASPTCTSTPPFPPNLPCPKHNIAPTTRSHPSPKPPPDFGKSSTAKTRSCPQHRRSNSSRAHTPTHTVTQACYRRILLRYGIRSILSPSHRRPRIHLPPKWQLLPRRPRSMAIDPRQRRLILPGHNHNHH
jgi:hypothetical protein